MNRHGLPTKDWDHKADSAANALKNRILTLYPLGEPPRTAYHYCGAEAMFNILTKEVWLSDLVFVNDPSEGGLIDELIKELQVSNPSVDTFEGYLIKHLRGNAAHVPKGIEGSWEIAVRYMLSMAGESDSLNLWRFYGDNGYGFAIEFDLSHLKEAIERELPFLANSAINYPAASEPITLSPVGYLDMEILARKIIDEILQDNEVKELASSNDGHKNILTWKISNKIYDLAYFYKSKDWAAEREVRAMNLRILGGSSHSYDKIIGHHVTGKNLVPHIKISTMVDLKYGDRSSDIIKSVTAGPRLDKNSVTRTFDQLINIDKRYYDYLSSESDFLKFSKCRY